MPALAGAAAALVSDGASLGAFMYPTAVSGLCAPAASLSVRWRFCLYGVTYERNRGLSRRGERRLAGLLARIFARRFCLQQRRNGPSPFPLREG